MLIWLRFCTVILLYSSHVSGAMLTIGAGIAAAISAGLMYLETQQETGDTKF